MKPFVAAGLRDLIRSRPYRTSLLQFVIRPDVIRTFQSFRSSFFPFHRAFMSKQRIEPVGESVADAGEPLVFSREQIRALDAAAVAELQISSLVLMENAARGLSLALFDHFGIAAMPRPQIVVVCGPGNNGGDGLALTRLLAAEGFTATTLMLSAEKKLSSDAATNCQILKSAGIPLRHCDLAQLQQVLARTKSRDVIVDCLLGTGVRGVPASPFAEAIDAINHASARVLSADVPSGLDCQNGTVAGACIRAEMTVSFVGPKHGFRNPEASDWLGEVRVAHIGLPAVWVRRFHARSLSSNQEQTP